MTLTITRSTCLYIHICATKFTDFTLFHTTASSFQVIGHFEKSALNDHKNVIEHYTVKGTPYIFIRVLESLISIV